LEITLAPPADPPKDVGDYYTGAPVQGFPAGVDIRDASVDANLRVMLQPTTGVPAELSDWVAEGELLLWISLYDPVPDPPSVVTDWLFALDLDGVLTTGRPPGTRRIDPDLGDEVAIGVSYNDVTRKYEPYFLVWDPALVDWSSQPEVPRFILSESRTLIGLALPLEALKQSVEQISGVTIVPEAVKGRAGVTSRAGEQRVIDFYPELPD
jgi:hypothetical protein